VTDEEALRLAGQVDSDGSGEIDIDEFTVFARSMMSITPENEFTVERKTDDDPTDADEDSSMVELKVTAFGMEIFDGESTAHSLSFTTLQDVKASAHGLTLVSRQNGTSSKFEFVSKDASHIVSVISQCRSRIQLRQDIQLHKQKRKLRAAFDMVDVSGDGSLDVKELGVLLRSLGEDLTEAELRYKMRVVDTNDSGSLEFNEFADLMVHWQEQELRDVFRHFDEDESGNISVEELSRVIQALGETGSTPEEATRLASYVDSDGSGLIDMDEFTVYMKPRMSIAQTFQAKVRTDSGCGDKSRGTEVELTISALGMEVSDGGGASPAAAAAAAAAAPPPTAPAPAAAAPVAARSYSYHTMESVEQTTAGFAVTVHHRETTQRVAFETERSAVIIALLAKNRAKMKLRREMQLQKQHQLLKSAFDQVDVSGDNALDVQEIGSLLKTLGEESLTEAELRDRIRQADTDGSGRIELEEFCELMQQWQDNELNDVFAFFDDNNSGNISLPELAKAIQALGEHGVSEEEALRRAAQVDSDGSGLIDLVEFTVFMKSMMSITQRHEYEATRAANGAAVRIVVGTLGLQVSDADGTFSYSFFTLVSMVATSNEITITVAKHGHDVEVTFSTEEATLISSTLTQQQAKLLLRQDIQRHKQLIELRTVFDLFDVDRSGKVDEDELLVLLETLGQNLHPEEIRAKVKEFDVDNSGDISFEEFVAWMSENQEIELTDSFHFFDKDRSGTISVVELQQMIQAMGQRRTYEEIQQLANWVDSDGSGEIDLDEYKVLIRPMLSLTDHATFYVMSLDRLDPALNGQGAQMIVSGRGIELQCGANSITHSFAKITDFQVSEKTLKFAVKTRDGNLALDAVEAESAEAAADILHAVKTQNGKLSLRQAIQRSKEPQVREENASLLPPSPFPILLNFSNQLARPTPGCNRKD
jgi:calmodulin